MILLFFLIVSIFQIFLDHEITIAAPYVVSGKIIVKLRSPETTLNQFNHNLSIDNNTGKIISLKKHKRFQRIYTVQVKEGSEFELSEHFNSLDNVEFAEPVYYLSLCHVPNDQYYPQQWALNTIQAGSAWEIETGSRDVIIAIVDTGVDYNHEDLVSNIWINTDEIPNNGIDDDENGYIDDIQGWDFVDAQTGASDEDYHTPDNDPMDRHGHGTHVAGIVGAAGDNGIGVTGVMLNCSLMPVRAGYKDSSGNGVLRSVDAALAILYAADNGAQIINASWGDSYRSALIEDAVQYASERGVLIIAAAGNENTESKMYPAAFESKNIISVGATDSLDQKAAFSNYGAWVNVSAPGSSLYSTYLNNGYTSMSGTSMATPVTAGIAGLIFSFFPDLTGDEVKARILRSVDILATLKGKNLTSGRVNAYSALVENFTSPYIFSISPDKAHQGDQITICGDSFGKETDAGKVIFSPFTNGEIISWSGTQIICTVPEGAETGEIFVQTNSGNSNSIPFTVIPSYYKESTLENDFQGRGEAQGWQADDQSWLYSLPFLFSFYGQTYDSVYVCSNGFLDFTDTSASYQNSDDTLKSRTMIAPLWDDLITTGISQAGEDIYINADNNSVSFRWKAENYDTAVPVNMEAVLYKDGRIQFNYSSGNTSLTSTTGVSLGNNEYYRLASNNGQKSLENAESVLFTSNQQDTQDSFTIQLNSGWNLISLPLQPVDNQVSKILGEVENSIESIWSYEKQQWQLYDPKQSGFSDLDALTPGLGYWINTTAADILTITGSIPSSEIELSKGWNLIGYNFREALPVEEALASIQGQYDSVWGYQNGQWFLYDPENPGFSDLEEIMPGCGYWIDVEKN